MQLRRWQERLDKAQVVLLHTLRYRGKRGFLIHRDSGLLLLQVEAKAVILQDGDLISGKVTAPQDFKRDSFEVQGAVGILLSKEVNNLPSSPCPMPSRSPHA
jgi:hypothetical protein